MAMDRVAVFAHCRDAYGTEPDYPWDGEAYAVLRHADTRKWYGVVMDLPKSKFGLDTAERTDVINLKLPSEMMGSFGPADGVYPAYHMNKGSWVSVLLDTASEELVWFLIGVSFDVTMHLKLRKRKGETV